VLDALLVDEPFEVTAVAVAGEGACYIDDRRDGDRERVATRHTDLLSRHELDDLYGRALTAGLSAEATVLCGTGEAERLPADLYRRLAADLRANGVVVVADLSGSFAEAALRGGLDVLKINADEAGELGEGGSTGGSDLVDLARRLVDRGADRVVLSRGGEPAYAVDREAAVELLAPRLEAADYRGAGDSMTAALAAGLAAGDRWEAVLVRATAAGAANVTRHGLGTAWASEVDALEPLVQLTAIKPGQRPSAPS
jgi:1-phosphofructokinase